MHTNWMLVAVGSALIVAACAGDPPEGLTETARGGGPVVVFDILHRPLPEIPLPNDVATRVDPTSPTGRRVNISLLSPTYLETDLRAKANNLAGFGIFMPITVAFDRPLDIAAIRAVHGDDGNPKDDAVYLVNVDRDSPGFGERIPISLGGGHFPVALEKTANYFENDARSTSMNILYDTVNEDRNCNGELDIGEDSDFDGMLDHPNVHDLEWHEDRNCNGKLDAGEDFDCDGELDSNAEIADGLHEDWNCNGKLDPGEDTDCDGELDTNTTLLDAAPEDVDGNFVLDEGETWDCGAVVAGARELRRSREDRALTDHLVDFFEQETNTLILRPVLPLRQHTTYAVALTDRLKGVDGAAIESPFPFSSHASQSVALEPLAEVLANHDVDAGIVRFAWTYTTGSTTYEMEAIRRGLYGAGTLSYLAEDFPATLSLDRLRDDDDKQPYIARVDDFAAVLGIVASAADFGEVQGLEHVSHAVVGTFKSPDFLVDRDGIAHEGYPADDDEIFELDPATGEAIVGEGTVTWWCAIPKETAEHKQPFPIQIYGHGYTSSKFEMVPMIGQMARFGIASCALDAFGHGLGSAVAGDPELVELAYDFLAGLGLGNFVYAVIKGRERDLDNDGIGDSGGDFWTADTFHTRDVVRQSIVDHLQFIRIVRAFDGEATMPWDTNADGFGNKLGDFDGDGTADMGGPDNTYSIWGISLGGILSAIVAGIEPAIDAAAPCAGGAGLSDIGIRSRQGGVPEAVFMPIFGPMISANRVADSKEGAVQFKFVINDVNDQGHYPFYTSTKIRSGDRIVLRNPRNEETDTVIVPQDLAFRVAVPADALTASEKRPLLLAVGPTPEDPGVLGDRLIIEVHDGVDGGIKETIDTFGHEVAFHGALHPVGTPLVALAKGLGLKRNTPEMRRFMGIATMILQGGDPVSYAPHYWKDLLDYSDYDDAKSGANVMVIPTVGDMSVPVNTGIHIAVAAGTVGVETPDPRYGKSQMQLLIDTYSSEAVERLWRYDFDIDLDEDGDCEYERTVRRMGLYDIDDLDDGQSEFHAPSPEGGPLRATVKSGDGAALTATDGVIKDAGGINAMRIPYEDYVGKHGLGEPNACRKFDIDRYMFNSIGWFFRTGGTELVDHPCLATDDCAFFPWKE